MFLLYFALLSALTPPVAVAAFTASAIADEDAMKIAITSVKLASVGFIIPFFFVWNEALLAQGSGLQITVAALGGIVAVTLLALAAEAKMNVVVRIVCLALGAAALSPYLWLAIPIIVLALIAGLWWKRKGGLPFIRVLAPPTLDANR
jgi:TRAP-type uncharacterized transport system fused permease subunit